MFSHQLGNFIKKNDPRMQCSLFIESQISTLQQLVFLHAPDVSDKKFTTVEDFDRLCTALLMTWDFMHPVSIPEDVNEALASLIQDEARRMRESSYELGSRAFFAYEIKSDSPSKSASQLRELFQRITGVSLIDYWAGGFSITMKEQTTVVAEIANGWSSTLSPSNCPTEKEARSLGAFHLLRCGSVEQVRAAIEKFDGGRPIHSFNLIGIRSFPIVEFDNDSRFVINMPAALTGLFGGIRHAILAGVLDGKAPEMNVKELGGLYGELFQDYVINLLHDAFGERFIRIAEDKENSRADGLIWFHDKVVVLEIKGSYPTAMDYATPKTLGERQADLTRLGVEQAAQQVASTIRALRSFELEPPGMPRFDWTTTTILPVIVTLERLPLMWKVWPLYDALTKPLLDLGQSCPIARVRFLSIGDVEEMPDCAAQHDLSSILLKWSADSEYFECPLSSFLGSRHIEYRRTRAKQRICEAMRFLVQKFDLDDSMVNWPQEA